MKLRDVFPTFSIAMTNEEDKIFSSFTVATPITSFTDREQYVIENLIRKSLVTKVLHKDAVWVVPNE